jgi:hypothetical protein
VSQFDPYHRWFGIPPHEQPPTHFRLLGVSDREDDPEVIASAAKRQFQIVKGQSGGPHSMEAKRLLHEILAARTVLMDPVQRQTYRARLQRADCPFDSTREASDAAPWTAEAARALPEQTDWFDPDSAGGDNPFAELSPASQGGFGAAPFDVAASGGGEPIDFEADDEPTPGVEFDEQGRRRRRMRPSAPTAFGAPTPPIRTRPNRGGLSAHAVAFIAFNVLLLAGFVAYQNSRAKNVRAERLAAEAAARRAAKDPGNADSIAATSSAPSRPPTTSAPPGRPRSPDVGSTPAASPRPEPVAPVAAAGPAPRGDDGIAAATSTDAPARNATAKASEEATPRRPGNRAFVEQSREMVEFAGKIQPLPAFKESCLYVNQDNFHSVDGSTGVLVEGILGGEVGGRQRLALVRAGKRLPLEFEFDPEAILPKSRRFAKEGERVLAYGWVLDDPIPNPRADERRRFSPPDVGGPVLRKAALVSIKPSRESAGDKRLQVVPQFQGYLGVVHSVPSWDVLVTVVNGAKTAANDVEIELVITNGKSGKVVTRELVEIGRVPAANKRNPVQKEVVVQNPNPDNPVVAFVEWRLVRAVFVGD